MKSFYHRTKNKSGSFSELRGIKSELKVIKSSYTFLAIPSLYLTILTLFLTILRITRYKQHFEKKKDKNSIKLFHKSEFLSHFLLFFS